MADREESPDWLRSFQPPSLSITSLSSDSDLSAHNHHDNTTIINSSTNTTPKRPAKRRKTDIANQPELKRDESLDKPTKTTPNNLPVWALSSDSEPHSNAAAGEEPNEEHDTDDEQEAASKVDNKKKSNTHVQMEATHQLLESMKKDEKGNVNGDSTSKVIKKKKSPKKKSEVGDDESAGKIQAKEPLEIQGEVGDAVEEKIPGKHNESRVSSSTLSLMLPEKVSRSKALVECEGESIDLSGDMGAVGRVIIPEAPSGEPEMFLDLKGTIYKTAIVPSRTFCVVSIGPSEAKIEAIMNDFIQLKAQSNVYDAETMVEGTLEGYSFDSEDEADKTAKDVKADQNEEAEEQTGKKPVGKVEKKLGATQKKGKAAGGKQPKKRKPPATKKGKGKK